MRAMMNFKRRTQEKQVQRRSMKNKTPLRMIKSLCSLDLRLWGGKDVEQVKEDEN